MLTRYGLTDWRRCHLMLSSSPNQGLCWPGEHWAGPLLPKWGFQPSREHLPAVRAMTIQPHPLLHLKNSPKNEKGGRNPCAGLVIPLIPACHSVPSIIQLGLAAARPWAQGRPNPSPPCTASCAPNASHSSPASSCWELVPAEHSATRCLPPCPAQPGSHTRPLPQP